MNVNQLPYVADSGPFESVQLAKNRDGVGLIDLAELRFHGVADDKRAARSHAAVCATSRAGAGGDSELSASGAKLAMVSP